MSTTPPPSADPVALVPTSVPIAAAGADDSLFCPDCGYDLRGIESSDRCPECGLAIDRDELATSRIPWQHRARIGRIRAYLRTARLATINAKTFAREVTRPVSYRDAQRFRIITSLLIAAAPAVAAAFITRQNAHLAERFDLTDLTWLSASSGGPPFAGAFDLALPWYVGAGFWPVVPAAILLFALLATGVPSYWFHPANVPVIRQNRAVALSHYSCAPLVLLLVPTACLGVVAWIGEPPRAMGATTRVFIILFAAAPVTTVIVLLDYYIGTLRLMRRTTNAGAGRIIAAIFGLPLAWFTCAALTLFAVPWVVGFVRLVWQG